MPEQIVEKQRNLIQNIQRLADMEDPEFTDFWQLLGYHDAITPEIQRVALAAEVFWPCEIYYHAPADVRDGLIHALLSAEYSSAASNLMSCLAMQGDDKAMETLLELERNPRPWRKGLYVDPSSYAQIGGWTFDKEGQKIQLNFDTCYPMVKGTTSEKSPVRIGRAREDTCPHCEEFGGKDLHAAIQSEPVEGGAFEESHAAMKYLAQIQWDTVFDCAEGTLYVEFCPDCHIVSMQHQQT